MQGELRASGDLLTAMLDQETGLRGFAQTGRPDFLEPDRNGRLEFERALKEAYADPERDPVAERLLRNLTATARQWQGRAAPAVERIQQRGRGLLRVEDVLARKRIMDRFRQQNARFRDRVEQRAQDRLSRARWTALVFVLLFGAVVLAFGLVAVERTARRDARRRRLNTEFIEALQGADDELEGKQLLRRQAERLAPGACAVVLTRNASGNSLEATTDPSALSGLAEALVDATPRSCLAIRRGRPHENRSASEPLQCCELCHRFEGGSVCVPSLVGGEVIGSVLAVRGGGVKAAEREAIAGAVTQAAPVLANLRNLAFAEHRAATDPLTRLPNARTLQETLIRTVAQAERSGTPLSAVVVDLDHFKALNDRHGHQAGDEVLQSVGATLRRGVRPATSPDAGAGRSSCCCCPTRTPRALRWSPRTCARRSRGCRYRG